MEGDTDGGEKGKKESANPFTIDIIHGEAGMPLSQPHLVAGQNITWAPRFLEGVFRALLCVQGMDLKPKIIFVF